MPSGDEVPVLLLLYFLWIHLCTEALGSPAEGHLRTEASGSKGLGRSDSGPHERERGRITAPSSRGSGSSRPSQKYLFDILPIDHLGWKHQGRGTPKSPRSLQLPEFLNPLLHKALRLSSCQPRIPNHSPTTGGAKSPLPMEAGFFRVGVASGQGF